MGTHDAEWHIAYCAHLHVLAHQTLLCEHEGMKNNLKVVTDNCNYRHTLFTTEYSMATVAVACSMLHRGPFFLSLPCPPRDPAYTHGS